MNKIKFTKMHGLGNDFMVIDGINQKFEPTSAPISAWAQRYTGVGFDQLLLIESPHGSMADFRYRIFNADGSEVEQCGNGARCFARFVYDKGLTTKKQIVVETAGGLISPCLNDDDSVTVDMGVPVFASEQIPFIATDEDDANRITHQLIVGAEKVSVTCINMGNPHAVVVVNDVDQAPVHRLGALIERHDQFPQKVNVGFMQILQDNYVRLRVFERGVGETQACGTGACAAVVAGVSLGLLAADKPVLVDLPGGQLKIYWRRMENKHVMMTGPVETVFDGEISCL